jgi:hypothetical protein
MTTQFASSPRRQDRSPSTDAIHSNGSSAIRCTASPPHLDVGGGGERDHTQSQGRQPLGLAPSFLGGRAPNLRLSLQRPSSAGDVELQRGQAAYLGAAHQALDA